MKVVPSSTIVDIVLETMEGVLVAPSYDSKSIHHFITSISVYQGEIRTTNTTAITGSYLPMDLCHKKLDQKVEYLATRHSFDVLLDLSGVLRRNDPGFPILVFVPAPAHL
jgi:hypothetical protein